jgi:predicted ATP-dependent protease
LSQHDETRQEPQLTQSGRELTAQELVPRLPIDAAELEQMARASDDAELFGQQRAIDAIKLAIGIDAPGYNLYVCGLRTKAERELVMRHLRAQAAAMPTPGDWVYVNNFRNPRNPVAIYLKPGQGRELREQLAELVNYVRAQLPKAFRQEDFEQERVTLRDKYNRRMQDLFAKLEAKARELGFAINSAPGGQIIFLPLFDGKPPQSPEDLSLKMNSLSDEERERLTRAQDALQQELATLMRKQQEMMRDLFKDIQGIERAFAGRLITPAIELIRSRFDNPAVNAYIEQVAEHMLAHLDRFREHGPEGESQSESVPWHGSGWERSKFAEYEVNVVVDNSSLSGAPVVYEPAPTYRNLFGMIERWLDPMGRVETSFARIVSGSYLRAHGGFLAIDVEEAVIEPGVWQTLKRSLKTGLVTPETFEPFPLLGGSGLRPDPLEIRTKVVLLGGPRLFDMLAFYDPDFTRLFKVRAEIRPVSEATVDAARHYAARVAALVEREGLKPFDAGALERIVRFGIRVAGEQGRLLVVLEPIEDLAREAVYFAQQEGSPRVGAAHVERALRERVLRLNYIEEEIRRLIAARTLVVELEGSRVGQVNGLAVLEVGGYAFGRPSRVTATVALGQAGVINIEREARLSGSIHDKGVMILAGFLRSRFGQEHPLAVSASICFEQSYSGIEGDSASSTELYALLSALSGVPIRQSLAVTGSVDQFGHIQAVGGINEKIEGMYRVCKTIGLTGAQGVLIPKANVRNLTLEEEVVSAVARGEFHIYCVDHIDQGLELLTGMRAGSVNEAGSVNYLAAQRLRAMAEALKSRGQLETRVVHEIEPPPVAPKPPGPPEPPS